MHAHHLTRAGEFYRVCDPSWRDPADTSFSKRYGGRWNPKGEFGALYLNASISAAIANARRTLRRHWGDAIAFTDLREEQRPQLQLFAVRTAAFVDAVTPEGIAVLGLPPNFPLDCDYGTCQQVARDAYKANEPGIACLSAAAPAEEELAVFDSHAHIAQALPGQRRPFAQWYR